MSTSMNTARHCIMSSLRSRTMEKSNACLLEVVPFTSWISQWCAEGTLLMDMWNNLRAQCSISFGTSHSWKPGLRTDTVTGSGFNTSRTQIWVKLKCQHRYYIHWEQPRVKNSETDLDSLLTEIKLNIITLYSPCIEWRNG